MSKIFIAIFLMLVLSSHSVHAKLYKWVDADGKVHYTDRIPPEQAGQERKELNSQGVTIKTTERAKTKEELEAAKVQAASVAAAKKLADHKATMDRTLTQAYATEEDLRRGHDNELAAIDSVIKTTQISLKSQESALAQHLAIAADAKAGKRVVPQTTLDAIKTIQTAINNQTGTINKKKAERLVSEKEYALRLARYRELKSKASQ